MTDEQMQAMHEDAKSGAQFIALMMLTLIVSVVAMAAVAVWVYLPAIMRVLP